mgnify:CR=1 FL=1
MTTLQYSLPAALDQAVTSALDDWQANDQTQRLWSRDASLWTGGDEAQWLDWLTIVEEQLDGLGEEGFVRPLRLCSGIQPARSGGGGCRHR